MCNRYRMTASRAELARKFGYEVFIEPERLPPPELFPKRMGYVVRKQQGARVLDIMSWGFPPPASGRAPITNVRNLQSPFWRSALSRPDRRCLVPVPDFCEWEGEKGAKIERWFSLLDQPIFAFAGVWRPTEAGNALPFSPVSRTRLLRQSTRRRCQSSSIRNTMRDGSMPTPQTPAP